MIRPRHNKFGARLTTVDGITFHSAAEAKRYGELRLLERAGEISNLELQPKFPITINGARISTYIADFRYFGCAPNSKRTEVIVEDVKGMKTQLYTLKKKLVEALYPGTRIVEVRP